MTSKLEHKCIRHITHCASQGSSRLSPRTVVVKDGGLTQPQVKMASSDDHRAAADARVSSSNDLDGLSHDTASRSGRDARLSLIDPAHWPTNELGVLATYDDMAECFRLTPPHDYDTDEVPYSLILGKGIGKGKGSSPRPALDLLPKGERQVKEPTHDEMASFSSLADILTWAKLPGAPT